MLAEKANQALERLSLAAGGELYAHSWNEAYCCLIRIAQLCGGEKAAQDTRIYTEHLMGSHAYRTMKQHWTP